MPLTICVISEWVLVGRVAVGFATWVELVVAGLKFANFLILAFDGLAGRGDFHGNEDVRAADIDAYFAPLGADDIVFPPA